ncbi:tryptophan--tRNA ligase [Halorubellus salinus]|uniref:tryptophan--tRNA ligase n=1 Tax=Halorubellus salinus TaxID=755309 RepID=UPI001D097DC8|nr:tryptophan--tRNA ligase [Halorubellus salinus]
MPAHDDDATATDESTSNKNAPADGGEFTVTPYEVSGDLDYDALLEDFGADRLTRENVERFPDHPLLGRGIYYAGRDVDAYLDAAAPEDGAGGTHSIVTGVGPSGPMHLGHALVFYLAKELQDATGATVYVPLSDDEKYLSKGLTFEEVGAATRQNLKDLLAVGFDPERTRIVLDSADADVVYPLAATFAKEITTNQLEAVYGRPDNVGMGFYPAVQTTHLLLPQLVEGSHPTLVPVAVDQDPHVRVSRDVAAKARYPVEKPGALLGKFLPDLSGPGKMSSSEGEAIYLTDDAETVREKVLAHAYSGGRESVDEHREHGGDPSVDVAFQYLRYFFERDDDHLADLAERYRSGGLLSGELKLEAVDAITDFLDAHQRRREALGDVREELEPYRLTSEERERALSAAGVPRL